MWVLTPKDNLDHNSGETYDLKMFIESSSRFLITSNLRNGLPDIIYVASLCSIHYIPWLLIGETQPFHRMLDLLRKARALVVA